MAILKLRQFSNYGISQIMAVLLLWQFSNYGSSKLSIVTNSDLFGFTEIVEEEAAAPVEEGYNYPVPKNPLELPEKSSHSELPDDAVAPLALYGAPAQPFELPPGKQTRLKNLLCIYLIMQGPQIPHFRESDELESLKFYPSTLILVKFN